MRCAGRKTLAGRLAAGGVLLLLASLLVGQFVATTHELTALHATCPRHGEVIDLDSRHARTGVAPADSTTQVSAPGEEGSQSQHQHCLFVSSRGSQKTFRIVGPVPSSASADAHWAPGASLDGLHPLLAVYRNAPKHSPPVG
jgi:hypothetical protein